MISRHATGTFAGADLPGRDDGPESGSWSLQLGPGSRVPIRACTSHHRSPRSSRIWVGCPATIDLAARSASTSHASPGLVTGSDPSTAGAGAVSSRTTARAIAFGDAGSRDVKVRRPAARGCGGSDSSQPTSISATAEFLLMDAIRRRRAIFPSVDGLVRDHSSRVRPLAAQNRHTAAVVRPPPTPPTVPSVAVIPTSHSVAAAVFLMEPIR
jgi:hypothetical protein